MSFNPLFKTKAIEAARLQTRFLGHDLSPLYEYHCEGDPYHLLGHCVNCGMRVDVDNAIRTLSGDALHLTCDQNALRCMESKAWLISKIPQLLLRRFQQELANSDETQRELFEEADFQPGNYALLSRDGVWALRYEIRQHPFEPISEENHQCASGVVSLEREVPLESMRWSCYNGPRLNPNGHENSELWLVLPLETGEFGWCYCDSNAHWRFRREDGVVGYHVFQEDCLSVGKQ